MQGRGKGRGGRNNSGRGNHRSSRSNNNKPTKTKLEDHVFHVGTAKHASDFDTNIRFILNHIKSTFEKHSSDIVKALEELKHPNTDEWKPDISEYVSTATNKDKKRQEEAMYNMMFKGELDAYNYRKRTYESNTSKAYGVLWARCSAQMQSQIESRDDFESKVKDDPVELIKAIKQHALNFKEHRYEMSIVANAMKTWLLSKQTVPVQRKRSLRNNPLQMLKTIVRVKINHL